MNWNTISPRMMVIIGVILFGTLMRLIPHAPNFTPIAAIALFAGAHLGKRGLAYLIPLLALFISDIFLGFHNLMIPVYIGIGLIVFMGSLMHQNIRLPFIFGGSVAGSILFFLITNFAVWLTTPFYPNTFQGLISCYTMAIPFFHNTLLSGLLYSGVFFGSFYLAQQKFPVLKAA